VDFALRSPPLTSGVSFPLPPQTLVDKEKREYAVSSEMSIEFEVDGPYKVGGCRVGWAGCCCLGGRDVPRRVGLGRLRA